jgi:hypothetical protein
MPMFDVWRDWIDAGLFAAEAQAVVALRMMRIASGGPRAAAETHRMVSEKFAALSAAKAAATSALVRGSSPTKVMRSALSGETARAQQSEEALPPPPQRLMASMAALPRIITVRRAIEQGAALSDQQR